MLTGSVGRQVGAVWIRIAVYQHDIDTFRNVSVAKRGMRGPIPAGHFLGVESDFLVNRAA
jgi:hypothetical protein